MFHCPSYFLRYLPILSINFNHLYQSTIYSKFILNSYRKKSSNVFNINFQLVDINWHSNPLYNKKNNKCNERRRIIERWYDLLAMEDGGWPRSVLSRIISFAAREDIVAALVKAGKIERRPLAVARGKLLFLSVHLWVPPPQGDPFLSPYPLPPILFFRPRDPFTTRSRAQAREVLDRFSAQQEAPPTMTAILRPAPVSLYHITLHWIQLAYLAGQPCDRTPTFVPL